MKTFATESTEDLLQRAEAVALGDASRDSDERWDLVSALHARGESSVFEAALSWCAGADPVLRALGANILGQLGFDEDYPFAKDSLSPLITLLGDPDDGVISSALIALGHLGIGAPSDVCLLATHESWDVRYAVASCLGGREDPLSLQTLVVLSSDSDEAVRLWATIGLATLSESDSSTVVEALIARLADGDDDVRLEALCGLAARGHPRAVPLIFDELGKAEVHTLAVEAAAECGDARFLVLLKELLDENPDDEGVQHAVECCTAS